MSEEKKAEPIVRRTDAAPVAPSRVDRSAEDVERVSKDGTALTMEERKALLRQEWSDDILPNVEGNPLFHYCWLSTTNQTDPIYRRLRIGYELVKYDELPHLGKANRVQSGEFAGCVSVNEMILAKIPMELYQELMLINHFEKPLREEELLNANIDAEDEEDSDGKPLGQRIGKMKQLVRKVRRPIFE
jgi:hypothetical protein